MAAEITVARESSVSSLNARSSTSSAGRQANPFRSITTRPISEAYRRELEAEGVNMRIFEQTRVDERNRRIDYELEKQIKQMRLDLQEKYPMAHMTGSEYKLTPKLKAEAKQQQRAMNRELAQDIKRLKRQAAAAKRK